MLGDLRSAVWQHPAREAVYEAVAGLVGGTFVLWNGCITCFKLQNRVSLCLSCVEFVGTVCASKDTSWTEL